MAAEKDTAAAPAEKPAKATKYKVVGLVALADKTMPVKVKGKVIDLSTASQEVLTELYKAKYPHVQIDG